MTEPAFAVPSRSLHLLAAAWGGLVGAIGLMVGLVLEPSSRHVVVGVAFLVGGFVAAARSPSRRVLDSLLALVLGYLLFSAFILLARLISEVAGPSAPDFADAGARTGLVTVAWALGGSVVGGVAATWVLRRQRGR